MQRDDSVRVREMGLSQPDLTRLGEINARLRRLLAATPCRLGQYRRKVPCTSGVYLISEPEIGHLYVGTSTGKKNHLRARIGQHIPTVPPDVPRKGSAATLAERMAAEAVGSHKRGKILYTDPTFRRALWRLRFRIEAMELRVLEIGDFAEVHALETFTRVVLQPRYDSVARNR